MKVTSVSAGRPGLLVEAIRPEIRRGRRHRPPEEPHDARRRAFPRLDLGLRRPPAALRPSPL